MGLPRTGDNAPDFKAPGFFRGNVSDYSLASCKGKWLVLFFYPADFTFICPTEVTGFSKTAPAFAAENAIILGASVDSIDSHRSWAEELGGLAYPLLSDESKSLSQAYGVLDGKRKGRATRDFYHQPGRRHFLSSREPRERRPKRGGNPARPEGAAHGASLPFRVATGRADGGSGAQILKIMDNGKLIMKKMETPG